MYTYIIVDTAEVTDEMIAAAVQTSRSTLRESSDGKTVLKWVDRRPEALADVGEQKTLLEMRLEVREPPWEEW